MQRIMEFLRRKKNNKGFSLVELIAAIAILSIVGASIAGIMIVSANTYANGTTEVELQESAQMLANQVNNLVQDGYEAVGTSGSLVIKTSTSTGDKQYNITQNGNKVEYSESILNADGSVASTSASEPMAENVEQFICDTTDFERSGVVKMYIELKKENSGGDASSTGARSFAGNFTATSRNIKTLTTVREGELTMNYTPEYILEPNQDFDGLYASMSDNSGIEWAIAETNIDPETVLEELPNGNHKIHIGKNESNEKITIILSSETRRSDGVTPRVQKTSTIYIRRINEIGLSYKNLRTNTQTKADVSAGAKYKVEFSATGFNLEKIPNVPDMGYDSYEEGGVVREGIYRTIDPRDVLLECEVRYNNQTYVGWSACSQFFTGLDYIQDFRRGFPSYVTFTLRQELGNGDYVKISCKAKHSLGKIIGGNIDGSDLITNITGAWYADINKTWMLYKTPFPESGGRITRGGGDRVVGNIDPLLTIIRSEAAIPNPERIQSSDVMKTYRYCEVELDESGNIISQGMWTNWRGFVFNDLSLKIPNEASLSLECNKSYFFEIQFEAYDYRDHSVKVWPTAENTRETYVYTEFIPKLSLYFDSIYWDGNQGRNVTIFQSAIGANYETDRINDSFSIEIDRSKTIGYALEGSYNEVFSINRESFEWHIERYDEATGSWTEQMDYEDLTYNQTYRGKLENIKINRKGSYRIYFNLRNIPHYYYVPSSQTYASQTLASVPYAEETTGKGFFYFTTTQNSDYWRQRYFEYGGTIYRCSEYILTEDGPLSRNGLNCSSIWNGSYNVDYFYTNDKIYRPGADNVYTKLSYTRYNNPNGVKLSGYSQRITRDNVNQIFASDQGFCTFLKQTFGLW